MQLQRMRDEKRQNLSILDRMERFCKPLHGLILWPLAHSTNVQFGFAQFLT